MKPTKPLQQAKTWTRTNFLGKIRYSYDSQMKHKIQGLENRFKGAIQFLNKTILKKEDQQPLKLNQLPWCLLIGPEGAGKTTLLANAGVNFTLQRQFQNQDLHHLEPSENCDWWITRDVCIVDVPGKYLTPFDARNPKKIDYSILWKRFLQLIKTNRGKSGINNIIIALPLPELLKNNEPSHLIWQQNVFRSIHLIQKLFPYPIPCHVIITKCDLIPGFAEFFAELGNDEVIQAWGVSLPLQKNNFKINEIFTERFDSLIKKLNQQLLYRLHHERNPFLRVQIKDFPLQVEQLKNQLLDFIKKFSATHFNLPLKNICLTSSIQQFHEERSTVLDEAIHSAQRQIQIFTEPKNVSRAYFIKHLLTHNIINSSISVPPTDHSRLKRNLTYGISIGLAVLIGFILLKDFRVSTKQSRDMQTVLAEYQHNIKQNHNSLIHLETTLALLDALQKPAKASSFHIPNIFSFYSNKSRKKIENIYYRALQVYLLPEIKEHFEEFLKIPVNQDPKSVYDALKSYLMLGDPSHFQAAFVTATLRQTLLKSMTEPDMDRLINHTAIALNYVWRPLTLNQQTVFDSRKYLSNIPNVRLGYIILKNMHNNENKTDLNLSKYNSKANIFASQTLLKTIPMMFIGNNFLDIYSKEVFTAVSEITSGNWVLNNNTNQNALTNAKLVDQLRNLYISHYTSTWENMMESVHLSTPHHLAELDDQLQSLIGNRSPLLQLLQSIRENTYFEPVVSASSKLRNINLLTEKSNNENNLYQILYGLQSLHQYLAPILNASDVKKAAFDLISARLKKLGAPDPILQLRLIASKSPTPVRGWLETISNHAWYFLVQEASSYLDMTWQNHVIQYYQANIANRYPFTIGATQEVSLEKFIQFFGKDGILQKFYDQYLLNFVDTSHSDWQWKVIDNQKLPFNNEVLRQIQQALLIQQIFFPNGDSKPYLRFSMQPFKFGNQINRVKFSIDDSKLTDTAADSRTTHDLIWPSNSKTKHVFVEVTLKGAQPILYSFPGDWGWFKLVNQSFENVITKKQMLLNFSLKDQPAKYILFVHNPSNPFLALNLAHFSLPKQLVENGKA